jgi:hypothetical protein
MHVRFIGGAALASLAFTSANAAAPLPRPPCDDSDPVPAYGEANDPAVESWSRLEWTAPPACLAWPHSRYRFVVAIAGRIEASDGAAVLS